MRHSLDGVERSSSGLNEFCIFTGLPIEQLRRNVAQENLFRYEEASVNWMPLGLSFCPSQ